MKMKIDNNWVEECVMAIGFLAMVIAVFSLGAKAGSKYNKVPESEKEYIFVSDRMAECSSRGGEYSIFLNYDKEYIESCVSPEFKINLTSRK